MIIKTTYFSLIITSLCFFNVEGMQKKTTSSCSVTTKSLNDSQLPHIIRYTYDPVQLPNDIAIELDRKNLINMIDTLTPIDNNRGITFHIEKPKERLGACIDVAIRSVFNITKQSSSLLRLPVAEQWIEDLKVLDMYFEQTAQPTENGLIVYAHTNLLDKKKYFQITHFGQIICVNNNAVTVRSKSGNFRQIIDHSIEYILSEYGTHAFFFTLKNKYKKDTQLLHLELEDAISENQHITTHKKTCEKILLQIAQGNLILYNSWYDFIVDTTVNDRPYNTTYQTIKRRISVNINTTNNNQETPLMLAAQRGDLPLVQLLVQYRAETDRKNNAHQTALDLAKKNSHADVVAFLTSINSKAPSQYYEYSIVEKPHYYIPTIIGTAKGAIIGTIIGITIGTIVAWSKVNA